MGWLARLLGRGGSDTDEVIVHVCRHVNLSPRWDSAEDAGKEEKASGYSCIACGDQFTPEQAQAMGRTPAV